MSGSPDLPVYQYWECRCGTRLEVPLTVTAELAQPVSCPACCCVMGAVEIEWIMRAGARTADGRIWSVPRPGRHDAVIKAMIAGGAKRHDVADAVQGFVTVSGHFLDRAEALALVQRTGQLKGKLLGGVLTSEDLW